MKGIFTFLLFINCLWAFGQVSQITAIPRSLAISGNNQTTFTSSNVSLVQSDDDNRLVSNSISKNASERNTQTLTLTNFDFSGIPAGSLINGIRVNIQAQTNSANIKTQAVQLRRTGGTFGSDLAGSNTDTYNDNSDELLTFGGQGNLFGTTAIPLSDLQNSTFGVDVQFRNSVAAVDDVIKIDYITITVFYNQRPVAVNDLFPTALVTNTITNNVLTNDSDPENNSLTATVVTLPTVGSLVLQTNGNFTYTPPTPFTGGDITFVYRITDNGTPANSSTATVTLSYPSAITPLPVEFISFEANKAAKGVQLAWKVGTEVNVNHYEVERSTDGNNFKKIGTVTASQNYGYSYTDLQPVNGVAYYRVRNVDQDGSFKYSTVVKYNNGLSTTLFKAFPTTTNTQVTFQHLSVSGKAVITINSLEGKSLRAIAPSQGSYSTIVDLSAYPSGMYLLRYQGENGNSETFRIVKQ